MTLLTHWQKSLENVCELVDEMEDLKTLKSSLIIINLSACSAKCEVLLKELNSNKNRVLVLHRNPDLYTAKEIFKSGSMGYGNAFMRNHFLLSAVNTIKDNMVWLYPEFTTQLINEIPVSNEAKNEEVLSKLTTRENEVALLLKDGYTYKDIAKKLNITPRTVKAHAKNTYSKLNVKDRVGLALLLK